MCILEDNASIDLYGKPIINGRGRPAITGSKGHRFLILSVSYYKIR